MTDTCICCGEVVPEGRMVCGRCELAANERMRRKERRAADAKRNADDRRRASAIRE